MTDHNTQKGSILVMATFLLIILIFTAGMAIDFLRLSNAKVSAEQVAEAIALKIARDRLFGASREKAEADATSYFEQEKSSIIFSNDATIAISAGEEGEPLSSDVVISGSVSTSLLNITGIDSLDYNISTKAILAAQEFEIALVLDVSQSMGNALEDMKEAAETLVDILMRADTTDGLERRISVIPYSDAINFGSGAENYLGADASQSFPDDFVGCFRPFSNADIITNNPTELPGEFRAYKQLTNALDNIACPPDVSSVLLFSDDINALTSKVRNLDFGFGTGSDIALSWGWRALSPSWRGRFNENNQFPMDHTDRRRKILIFLTDGKPFRASEEGDGVRGVPQSAHDQALANFNQLCGAIAAEGKIELFTIGFELDQADMENRTILENCTALEGRFVNSDRNNLREDFKSISQQIVNVRVIE